MKTEITWEEVKIFFEDKLGTLDKEKVESCTLRFKNLSLMEKIDFFHSMKGEITEKMKENINRCTSEAEKKSRRGIFERRLIFHKREWLEYLLEGKDEKPTDPIL